MFSHICNELFTYASFTKEVATVIEGDDLYNPVPFLSLKLVGIISDVTDASCATIAFEC